MARKKTHTRKKSGGRKQPARDGAQSRILSVEQEYRRRLWEKIGEDYDQGVGWRSVMRGHGGAEEGWVWRFRPSADDYTFTLAVEPARTHMHRPIPGKWDVRLFRGQYQSMVITRRDSKDEVQKFAERWLVQDGLDPVACWDKTYNPDLTPWERDDNYRRDSTKGITTGKIRKMNESTLSRGYFTNITNVSDATLREFYDAGNYSDIGHEPDLGILHDLNNALSRATKDRASSTYAGGNDIADVYFIHYFGRPNPDTGGAPPRDQMRRVDSAVTKSIADRPFIYESVVGDISSEGDYVTHLVLMKEGATFE